MMIAFGHCIDRHHVGMKQNNHMLDCDLCWPEKFFAVVLDHDDRFRTLRRSAPCRYEAKRSRFMCGVSVATCVALSRLDLFPTAFSGRGALNECLHFRLPNAADKLRHDAYQVYDV